MKVELKIVEFTVSEVSIGLFFGVLIGLGIASLLVWL